MATFDYTKTRANASRMLTRFGQVVTLRHVAEGAYDPATGTGANVNTDNTRKAVLLDFGAGVVSGSGGLVEMGDKRLIMEAGVVPQLGDLIIAANGDTYVVKGVGEVNPAGTAVIYDLHLRK